MSEIVRFSVSLEDDLLERFDGYCAQQKFATRSEAVRQLIQLIRTHQADELVLLPTELVIRRSCGCN